MFRWDQKFPMPPPSPWFRVPMAPCSRCPKAPCSHGSVLPCIYVPVHPCPMHPCYHAPMPLVSSYHDAWMHGSYPTVTMTPCPTPIHVALSLGSQPPWPLSSINPRHPPTYPQLTVALCCPSSASIIVTMVTPFQCTQSPSTHRIRRGRSLSPQRAVVPSLLCPLSTGVPPNLR